MKMIKHLSIIALTVSCLTAPLAGFAADKTDKAADKPRPYTLTTCPVSGDKLGAMDKPFVFTYKDREIKLCCKSCKKDFDKDPAKFIKKIDEAEKVAATKAAKK